MADDFFYRLGFWVAKHAKLTLIISFILVVGCCFGFANYREETDGGEVRNLSVRVFFLLLLLLRLLLVCLNNNNSRRCPLLFPPASDADLRRTPVQTEGPGLVPMRAKLGSRLKFRMMDAQLSNFYDFVRAMLETPLNSKPRDAAIFSSADPHPPPHSFVFCAPTRMCWLVANGPWRGILGCRRRLPSLLPTPTLHPTLVPTTPMPLPPPSTPGEDLWVPKSTLSQDHQAIVRESFADSELLAFVPSSFSSRSLLLLSSLPSSWLFPAFAHGQHIGPAVL